MTWFVIGDFEVRSFNSRHPSLLWSLCTTKLCTTKSRVWSRDLTRSQMTFRDETSPLHWWYTPWPEDRRHTTIVTGCPGTRDGSKQWYHESGVSFPCVCPERNPSVHYKYYIPEKVFGPLGQQTCGHVQSFRMVLSVSLSTLLLFIESESI